MDYRHHLLKKRQTKVLQKVTLKMPGRGYVKRTEGIILKYGDTDT